MGQTRTPDLSEHTWSFLWEFIIRIVRLRVHRTQGNTIGKVGNNSILYFELNSESYRKGVNEAQQNRGCDPVIADTVTRQSPLGTRGWYCVPRSHISCSCAICMLKILVFKILFGSLIMYEGILDGHGSLWAKKPLHLAGFLHQHPSTQGTMASSSSLERGPRICTPHFSHTFVLT